jgi:hypothetical protein
LHGFVAIKKNLRAGEFEFVPRNQVRSIVFNIFISTVSMSSELLDHVIRPMLMNESQFLVVEGYVAAKHAHPVEVLLSECRGLVLEALDLCVGVTLPDKQVRLGIFHCGCKMGFADQ